MIKTYPCDKHSKMAWGPEKHCYDDAFNIDDEELLPANDLNADGVDEDQSAKRKRNEIADLLSLWWLF